VKGAHRADLHGEFISTTPAELAHPLIAPVTVGRVGIMALLIFVWSPLLIPGLTGVGISNEASHRALINSEVSFQT